MLRQMNDNGLKEFSQICFLREYKAKEIIFLSDQETGFCFLLLRGKVSFHLNANGKNAISHFFTPGDFFGDFAFIKTYPIKETFYTQANTNVIVCVMKKNDLERFLKKNPNLAIILISNLHNRLRQAESKIKNLTLTPIRTKLIGELKRLAVNNGQKDGGYLEINEKLTHKQLAKMIGASRESVGKNLKTLREQNIIHYDGKKNIRLRTNLKK